MQKITIYTTPMCAYCKMTKAFFVHFNNTIDLYMNCNSYYELTQATLIHSA